MVWVLLVLYFCIFPVSCAQQAVYPQPPLEGSDVVIQTDMLKPEIPQFFTYHFEDKNISFFVIKIGNDILSFLDACEKCYPKKRGYRFDNGFFICRACNMEYAVSEIEHGIGSCVPIKISGVHVNGKYIIPLSSLEDMSDKF